MGQRAACFCGLGPSPDAETAEESSWLVELVAHQSSLPLALAILYQNYRFAFADLFLKRAISLILVAIGRLRALCFRRLAAAPLS